MASVKDRPYSRKEVSDILHTVMSHVGTESEAHKKLQAELKSLSDFINSTRSELAQMRSIEISHNHIPTATDELDAIVGETAKATGAIMDACDAIMAVEGVPAAVQSHVNSIYEACSFQDITGQRITKVVKSLKHIETKVEEILHAFGHALPRDPNAQAQGEQQRKADGAGLLNGPQLAGPSVSQDDIDALLAGFDK
jgi:chemotaxis protein CheZ